MTKVYFKKTSTENYEKLGNFAKELLDIIVKEENYKFNNKMPVKVHFGEKGNKTFTPAYTYNQIIDYIKSKDSEPFYIETNVLYRGERTTRDSHIKLAKEHGFTQLPIVIADGDIGDEYTEVEINKDYFKSCKIGKEYNRYDKFIVLSHFKGHEVAGFGGALKQLAMGFASRGGKLAQHSEIAPVVKTSKCIGCGICVENCDVDAISIKDGVAFLKRKKCIGCAGCMAVCPEGAIVNSWKTNNFREKLAEYAYAASLNKDNIYISFIINITKKCDCIGHKMDIIADNVGVVASTDPLALDAASLDLLQNSSREKLFSEGRETLIHGEKIGIGSLDYDLIEV
ncbi:MAG: DUF362 domain-containing protein [Bacillota bacterium]|nr:DUF362 domain-containing protein [Bacillota bacterium]